MRMLTLPRRRAALALLLLLALLIVPACVPSLHGLYKPEDLVFDEALLGEWSADWDKQRPEVWTFARLPDDDKAYLLTITSEDEAKPASTLQARLVQLGDKRFLDLYVADIEQPLGDWTALHLVPAHTFMALKDLQAKHLNLAGLNPDKLDKLLKADPTLAAHERPTRPGDQQSLVLTASTEQLQRLVTTQYDTLFDGGQELRRKPEAAATQPAN